MIRFLAAVALTILPAGSWAANCDIGTTLCEGNVGITLTGRGITTFNTGPTPVTSLTVGMAAPSSFPDGTCYIVRNGILHQITCPLVPGDAP